jgi:hypothetical protein
MERLLRVAPLDIFFRGQRLSYFVFARQYERALEEVERIRELDPDFVGVNVVGTYRSYDSGHSEAEVLQLRRP